MRKTKEQKAITLIALIITIVVLLILASVAINSIQNDGILSYAQNAAEAYNQAVRNEQSELGKYQEYLDKYLGVEITYTMAEAKNTVLSTTSNTKVVDEYGNQIVVPAGFKIRVDSTTNNADTVTEGIVIEDCTEEATNGSQFVWIPVGKIYTDTERTESLAKTITLGRYSFDSTTGAASAYSGSSFTEDTVSSHNSSYWNAIARDIEAFKTSANTKGGYYLGRYEARTNNTTGRSSKTDSLTAITSIQTNAVYNYVTQAQASSLAQGMYADGYSSGTFSSDLINSYAWDTAIVFLQTFDNRADKTKPYSQQKSLNTGSVATTGTTTDIICNIYDMASNCWEWSTETYSHAYNPCVYRGGFYDYSDDYTSLRSSNSTSSSSAFNAFRPLLYVGL